MKATLVCLAILGLTPCALDTIIIAQNGTLEGTWLHLIESMETQSAMVDGRDPSLLIVWITYLGLPIVYALTALLRRD